MFAEYLKHGWKLCAIPAGSKGPTYPNWNTVPIDMDKPGFVGAGLLHALSGSCALDIDQMELARPWLAERGVDVDALLNDDKAVQISSGRPGRAKLLYAMKRPMRTVKPKDSGLELRCATANGASVQDVLPPSIHPVTKKPYEWAGGIVSDWRELPPIPATLLNAWRELAEPIEQSQPVKHNNLDKPQPVNLAKLRKAIFRKDPNCEYDEWIKVLAQCHDATRGGQEGLDLLDEWSSKATRKQNSRSDLPVYQGKAAIKVHYITFGGAGKHIATGEALLNEVPPEDDDFEVIPEATAEAEPVDEGATARRAKYREDLFERYVFVTCQETYFDRERSAPIGDKAMRHMHTPFMPFRNGRLIDPIDELMRNPAKTIVEALAFHPGEKSIFEHEGIRYGNTYVDNFPTPIEPMKDELDRIEWIFNRIEDVAFREWLRQFFAHIVQHPGIKIRTAPLILSKVEGNGKSMTCHRILELLVGKAFYAEVDAPALNSEFNDYLIGKWGISLTEFRTSSRMDREVVSKKAERWVADDNLQVNPKNKTAYTVPNYLVVTATSNKPDAIQLDEYNRKWTICWLTAPAMTEEEKSWMFEGFLKTSRARAVLRHYFLHVPITSFNPNSDALKTAARAQMIKATTAADEEYLLTAFEQLSEPLSLDVVITQDVADIVRQRTKSNPSSERIGHILSGPPFNGVPRRWNVGKSWYRGWVLRGQTQWLSAGGNEIMAYITDGNVSIAADDLLL